MKNKLGQIMKGPEEPFKEFITSSVGLGTQLQFLGRGVTQSSLYRLLPPCNLLQSKASEILGHLRGSPSEKRLVAFYYFYLLLGPEVCLGETLPTLHVCR